MEFVVPRIDLRNQSTGQTTIIDKATGETVGLFRYSHGDRERVVALFGEKYVGSFATHEECVAFAKGVASVLGHMTSMGGPK